MVGRIGRYRIERQIGTGATGVVYLGHDDELNRRAAIKVLVVPDAVQGPERQEMISRFRREARAAAAVSHPNIAAIYEVGTDGDRNFIAMEYCEGTTLRDILAMQGPPPESRALDIALQILDALQAAHDAGVCHRDVKPDNVMVSPSGKVKVMDFGIARAVGDVTITRTGTMVGTPAYMSPEQILGKPTDHRSDIFSMGILLHEILTGRRPFEGATITQITHAIAYEEPKLSSSLRPELLSVIIKALYKTPSSRFQSAREMSLALQGKVPVQMPQSPQTSQPVQPQPATPTSAQATPTIAGPAPPVAPPQISQATFFQGAQSQYCGFWPRFGAAVLDSMIVSLAFWFLVLLCGGSKVWLDAECAGIVNFCTILAWAFYEVFFIARGGQTPGKMAAGIVVLGPNGQLPSLGVAILRHLGKWISSLTLGLGYLWVAWDLNKQGFHDKIAGTVVVPKTAPTPHRTTPPLPLILAVTGLGLLGVLLLATYTVDQRAHDSHRLQRDYGRETSLPDDVDAEEGSLPVESDEETSFAPADQFDVSCLSFSRDEYVSYVTGLVRNNTNRTYSYVQIEINLYDASGTQVGSTMDNCNNLEPYGYWRFKAPVFEDSATTCRVKGVTAF